MSEMIERVAQAMCAVADYPIEADVLARAAIEAMREPPSAVWIAMMNTKDDGGGDLHYRKWQAAIDAALSDQRAREGER